MSQRKQPKKVPSKASLASPMSVDLLQELIKLMSANDLNTVEVRDGAQRIVLKRGAVAQAAPMQHAPAAPAAANLPSGAPAAFPGGVASPAGESTDGLIAIKSPMVGTFYARPTPEAKILINVGSVVNEETDVCIIEAMKVFNNIKAEVKGTVAKILAEDGKPVEFGQVLFLVKP